MDNRSVSTTYVSLPPPYQIIKHGHNIGVKIGTQRVTITSEPPLRIETHNFPVVAEEEAITPETSQEIEFERCTGKVWDNIEEKDVSVLGIVGKPITWMEFIKILWHDHARMGDPQGKIQKLPIYNKILKYNKTQQILCGFHTIHLQIYRSNEQPEAVRSAEDDIFALNVAWDNDPAVLASRLEEDLMGYLLIISPNRQAKLWHLTYETTEKRLLPVVERLNASKKATSFRNTMMASITIKALPMYDEKAEIFSDKKPTTPPKKKGEAEHKSKGRGKAPDFWTYLKSDTPQEFKPILEEMLRDKTGKDAFKIILAVTDVWINEPMPQSVVNKFKSVTKTPYSEAKDRHYGMNSFIGNAQPVPKSELQKIRKEIERKLAEKSQHHTHLSQT